MNQILITYLPIAVLLGIAIFFALFLPIASVSLGPKRAKGRSLAPYESLVGDFALLSLMCILSQAKSRSKNRNYLAQVIAQRFAAAGVSQFS